MSKINAKDRELIASLGRFRILTVKQLAAISQRSIQVVRRRIRSLAKNGIVSAQKQPYGNIPGRPEDLLFLTVEGRDLLLDKNDQSKKFHSSTIRMLNSTFTEHKLYENWFFIHLIHIERINPKLTISFKTFDSINLHQNNIFISRYDETLRVNKSERKASHIIPDGVFSISDLDSKKTLLFFLEVDMGTETISSPKQTSKDIRQKIINYQKLFHNKNYKYFEKPFNCKFNGFRLLFVCKTNARLRSLCRLVASTPTLDFIWLTNFNLMFKNGLAETIWTRGGFIDKPCQSILGPSLSFKSTLLENLR